MANTEADLIIGLRWRGPFVDEDGHKQTHRGIFDIHVGYDDSEDVGDKRDFGKEPIEINVHELSQLVGNEADYGAALSAQLFASKAIRDFYAMAKGVVEDRGIELHLRLHVDPGAPAAFHVLRWESLRDPIDGSKISLKSNFCFSRFLSGKDWRPIQQPRKHDLRALVVVADPSNLARSTPGGRQLTPVDVSQELKRAREALQGIDITELAIRGEATLQGIIAAVESGIDILYLVCHGALITDEPILYLESPDGEGDPTEGSKLVERIAQLDHRPTIAVLCSCDSAGAGEEATTADAGALAPLGPRLAGAGVAAVIAMQGNVTMATAGAFLGQFFAALKQNGVVDRAVAVGRRSIQDRHDWWVPVLFSRRRKGRTYYTSAFVERSDRTWSSLIDAITAKQCTPIIGPGLSDSILGSRTELASNWVDRWEMPISASNQQNLTTVAQYLRVQTARQVPPNTLCNYLLTTLHEQYGKELPPELFEDEELERIVNELGTRAREQPDDPYRVVTSLRLPVYVTTSWTGLLDEALRLAGRPPSSKYFDWRNLLTKDQTDEERPRPERPIVYHLFGRLDEPESLVLTEDDHFEWLCAWVDKRDLIPKPVSRALTSKSLLFLGYRLEDWDFRVLFQGFKTFGGAARMRELQHVGVQLDPTSQVVEPEAAQEYLESYFGEDKVSIYWGETGEFLAELNNRMRAQ